MHSKILWKLFTAFLLVIGCSLLIPYFFLATNLTRFIFSAVLALSLASVLGLVLSRSLTRSLERIAEVAKLIAGGDFSKRLPIASRDERGDLARAINEMAESLGRQFSELEEDKAQLKTILDGMVEGVMGTNERKEILLVNPALPQMLGFDESCIGKSVLESLRNQALNESVEKVLREGRPQEQEISMILEDQEKSFIVHSAPLMRGTKVTGSVSVFSDVTRIRKLESMRKDFVANVSHELKTPLTSIRGYAETLLRGALKDPDAAGRFVEKIEKNSGHLQHLVEDLLKLSEIESGRVELNQMSTSLTSLVSEVKTDFDHRLNEKQLNLDIRIEGNPMIFVDPDALKQILSNLIDNAVKYTPAGGNITLSSEIDGNWCRVNLSDTGVGINEKDLPHVFERFYRADKSRSRQMGSTGLGLSIVKHIVQAHGGEVSAVSEVGKGSKFSFTIPLFQGVDS